MQRIDTDDFEGGEPRPFSSFFGTYIHTSTDGHVSNLAEALCQRSRNHPQQNSQCHTAVPRQTRRKVQRMGRPVWQCPGKDARQCCRDPVSQPPP